MAWHNQIVRLMRAAKGSAIGLLWRRKGVILLGRINIAGTAPRVWSAGKFSIGKRVQFRNIDAVTTLTCHTNSDLSIGDRCFINEGVQIDCWRKITIGQNCQIGPGCVIADTSYHEIDERSGVTKEPIEIGRNVWLARNVTVLPGVSIGDHSVVAAGAIVTKSFPEKSLIAGIPARKIRDIEASHGYVRPG